MDAPDGRGGERFAVKVHGGCCSGSRRCLDEKTDTAGEAVPPLRDDLPMDHVDFRMVLAVLAVVFVVFVVFVDAVIVLLSEVFRLRVPGLLEPKKAVPEVL